MLNEQQEQAVLKAITEAGRITKQYLVIIGKGEMQEQYKKNKTVVTEADLESSAYLEKTLHEILPIPVLSEENTANYPNAPWQTWDAYWLIDPLDGTKRFLRGEDYHVLVTLMVNQQPEWGFIHTPITEITTVASKPNQEAYRYFPEGTKKILQPTRQAPPKPHRIAKGNSFKVPDTDAFIKELEPATIVLGGAAEKFIQLAENEADIYPNFFGIWDWDVAAGHLLLQLLGGEIYDAAGKPLRYGAPDLRVARFVALRRTRDYDRIPWADHWLMKPQNEPDA